MGLTFDQVKLAGRYAYRDDLTNHYMLAYDPSDASVLVAARDRPYPETGVYADPVPFDGDPPEDGWYHLPPCDCEFCETQ